MASGTLVVHLSASNANVPIVGAAVTFTQTGAQGQFLAAVRITNDDGQTEAVEFSAPQLAQSQTPQPGRPWAVVDVTAEHPAYGRAVVRDVQIFSDTVTQQDITLIPLEQFPDSFTQTRVFTVPPFDL